MLAIRMQRTGRKGYASFRVVVQDSKFSPTSGRVVSKLGHHNPHTKETVIDKEKAEQYLSNGAQPSPRVVRLFALQKVKMPEWVEKPANSKKRFTKNPDKLRKHQPAPEKEEAPKVEEAPVVEAEKAEAEAKPETEDSKDEKTEEKSDAA